MQRPKRDGGQALLTLLTAALASSQLGADGGCGTSPTVTLWGKAGTFGGLTNFSSVPSGDPLRINGYTDYALDPGQASWFPAVTSDGTVFVATLTQSGSQLYPTACTMEVACFHPSKELCRNPATGDPTNFALLTVPHASGTYYPSYSCPTAGGADVSDLQVIGSGAQERVAFVSYYGSQVSSVQTPDGPCGDPYGRLAASGR